MVEVSGIQYSLESPRNPRDSKNSHKVREKILKKSMEPAPSPSKIEKDRKNPLDQRSNPVKPKEIQRIYNKPLQSL